MDTGQAARACFLYRVASFIQRYPEIRTFVFHIIQPLVRKRELKTIKILKVLMFHASAGLTSNYN